MSLETAGGILLIIGALGLFSIFPLLIIFGPKIIETRSTSPTMYGLRQSTYPIGSSWTMTYPSLATTNLEQAMSPIFTSLLHWAQQSGVLDQAQKAAMGELQTVINQAVTKATAHAPDMTPIIEQAANQMVTATIAGLATKASGK